MNVIEKLQIGTQLHQAGRLHAAVAIYEEILHKFPDHPDALHRSGLVTFQQSNSQRAIQVLGKRAELFAAENAN